MNIPSIKNIQNHVELRNMKKVALFVKRTPVWEDNVLQDDLYDYDFVIAENEEEAEKLDHKYNYKRVDAEKFFNL